MAEEAEVRRIVSLLPAATEILVELGARDRLVALSRADTVLLGDSGLPSVGDPLTPSLEVIVAVRPDLIVAWRGMESERFRRFVPESARLVGLEITDFAGLDRAIDTLGALIDEVDRAGALRRSIRRDLASAATIAATTAATDGGPPSAARRPSPPPVVAWVVWAQPIIMAGHGTFIHEVLEAAGGRNVLEPEEGSWPVIGIETLIVRDPDVIVWPRGGGMPPPPGDGGLWDEVPAFRDGAVLRLSADRFHVPGPGSGKAVAELAGALDSVAGSGPKASGGDPLAGRRP